jgi:excinuclease UvrABC ATPase subunit
VTGAGGRDGPADRVVDLGPDGGDAGGILVFTGGLCPRAQRPAADHVVGRA